MRLLLLLALLSVTCPASADVCINVPLEQQLQEASIVFIATITGATGPKQFQSLKNGANYRVNYTFTVREQIKGTATDVKSLFTINIYHAFDAGSVVHGEDTRLVPGDNVLVIANTSGDSQVASCTPSRQWIPTAEQIELLHSPSIL